MCGLNFFVSKISWPFLDQVLSVRLILVGHILFKTRTETLPDYINVQLGPEAILSRSFVRMLLLLLRNAFGVGSLGKKIERNRMKRVGHLERCIFIASPQFALCSLDRTQTTKGPRN